MTIGQIFTCQSFPYEGGLDATKLSIHSSQRHDLSKGRVFFTSRIERFAFFCIFANRLVGICRERANIWKESTNVPFSYLPI